MGYKSKMFFFKIKQHVGGGFESLTFLVKITWYILTNQTMLKLTINYRSTSQQPIKHNIQSLVHIKHNFESLKLKLEISLQIQRENLKKWENLKKEKKKFRNKNITIRNVPNGATFVNGHTATIVGRIRTGRAIRVPPSTLMPHSRPASEPMVHILANACKFQPPFGEKFHYTTVSVH